MPMSAIVVVSYNHPQYLQPCWNTWNIELHHYKKGPMISTVNHIYICWIPFQQGMLRSWRPKGLNESVADGQNLVPHRYLHTKSAQSKATRAVAAPDLRSTGISSFVRISRCKKKIKATMNYTCLNLVLFMAFLQDMFFFHHIFCHSHFQSSFLCSFCVQKYVWPTCQCLLCHCKPLCKSECMNKHRFSWQCVWHRFK